LPDARREGRVIEEQPRFIEDQQRGRTVETFIEAGEQVAQHRLHGGGAVHQLFHLEALHVGHAQPVVVGVQQLAVRAAQHIGRERLAQRVRLQQHRQAGHRALLHRRTGKASSADQMAAFSSGPTVTPSCSSRPSTHSAAQVR
jgi:hypothetical protein